MDRSRVSIGAVWMAVAVALPAFAALLVPLSTVDLAYQIRTGDLILAERAIPTVDTFTFSAAGMPWTVQQWGAAVTLAAGFAPAGWAGLIVLRASLVTVIFGLVLLACRTSGASPRAASLLTLAAFVVALPGLGLRAQLLGLLCFAAVLTLVALRRRRPRLLLLAPLFVLAWANMHGTFALALLVLGWALLDDLAAARHGATRLDAVRRDLFVLALATLATLVTPFGPGTWVYVVSLSTSPAVAGLVSEWQPTSVHTAAGLAFVASAIGVGWLLALRGRRSDWPTLTWLAVLFALAAWTERGIPWWALGAAVACAPIAARPREAQAALGLPTFGGSSGPVLPASVKSRARAVNGVLCLAICAAPVVLSLFTLVRPADGVTGPPGSLRDAPPGITRAVLAEAAPGMRIFNAQRWGSWLEWAIPGALMFTDSRFEVVPDQAWSDHVAVSGGRFDWAEILDRVRPDLIVASRTEQSGLLDAMASGSPAGWRQVYSDDDGVVFAR